MKKRSKTILTAILIGAALGISAGALSAYMTSSETATNTFTAGEVKIDLQEPAWKPEDGKHLVAKQTVLKDPKIKNTGKNPAYVFMTVQVQVRTLTLYNDAGRKEEYSETTELFNLKKNVNGIYETLSDTNSGNWVLLKDRSTYGTKDESFTTYVYAYRVPVEPNATSDALFDAVQLKNVIEGYSEMSKLSTKDEYPITINGYAIQATDVIGTDGSDVTEGTVTTDDLLRMYDTYVNQNGTRTGSSMNLMTDPSTQYKDGKIVIYASEAKFTDDPIEDGYFGCGGVAEIPHLQDKCITLAKGGFKHHTAICEGHYKDILKEAFTTYLGYEWVDIDG